MSRFKRLWPTLLGLGIIVMTPVGLALAKGGGGGGGHGGGGGGGHGGGGHGGGGHGGSHGVYRGGFYGGFYGGAGFYNPYWYGYAPYYDYGPSYGYAVPVPVPVPGSNYLTPPAPPAPQMPPADLTTAVVNVQLPRSDAKVWVDNNLMTEGSGSQRVFISPSLEAGYNYSYQIRASWMDNGQEVTAQRKVAVAPGRVSQVDFSKVNTQFMPEAAD
jgi:uncharacterized protein (TIGR03000 family)